jgi:hypothetical protein
MQNADRQKSAAGETISLIKVCSYEPLSRYSRCDVDYEFSVFQILSVYYLEVI